MANHGLSWVLQLQHIAVVNVPRNSVAVLCIPGPLHAQDLEGQQMRHLVQALCPAILGQVSPQHGDFGVALGSLPPQMQPELRHPMPGGANLIHTIFNISRHLQPLTCMMRKKNSSAELNIRTSPLHLCSTNAEHPICNGCLEFEAHCPHY